MRNNFSAQATTEQAGFSLVEMAVVLAVVALLLSGLLPTLSSQMELKRINEARVQMDDIRSSLLGFAVSNGRLPCPDTDSPKDGIENFSTTPTITNNVPQTGQSTKTISCAANEGGLPFNQIGIAELDPFNSPYIYRTRLLFAEKNEVHSGVGATGTLLTTTYFGLGDSGNLKVCKTEACTTPTITDNAVAVIVSKGANWALPPSNEELENTDNDNNFVSHENSSNFDDLVVWLSPNVIFNRMVQAGKLP